jgi:hypothetical protein
MRLTELLAIPIGFALVRSITKSIDKEPAAKVAPIIPKQTGFTLGPAAASMDIKPLIPEGAFKITPAQLAAFTPQTPEQQAFTRERILAPSGTPEQAKMLIESGAIRQGKITKFGTGVSLADLLARQTPRK